MGFWNLFRRKVKKGMPNALKFTCAESFRFFTEALRAQQVWAKTLKPEDYTAALDLFRKAVEAYPNDALPNFYYGFLAAVKEENRELALKHWEIVTKQAPGTNLAEHAASNIIKLKDFKYPPEGLTVHYDKTPTA